MNVQRQVVERLNGVGVELEARPYHPHLTLARWKSARPTAGRQILALAGGGEVAEVGVERVTLMQSRLSSVGPTYVPLTYARLGGQIRG